jgi:acyl-coenzyme A synthetase/AMP-(fatty) acid ligase
MGEQVAETFNFAATIMEQWARRRPHDPALWWVDEAGTAGCYSFAKLADRFRRASRFLHKAGIRCGDRVLVMQPRVPAWWIVMPGLIRFWRGGRAGAGNSFAVSRKTPIGMRM